MLLMHEEERDSLCENNVIQINPIKKWTEGLGVYF